MFGFLKKKKAPPPKKVKKPVDIKKVSAQYKVVLKQERFRKDVAQIKKKNVIDFHNLRYYLQKQKPHLYRKKYKVIGSILTLIFDAFCTKINRLPFCLIR